MAKKKKGPVGDREKPLAQYYELHTGAIDDLVTADRSNSPEVSPQELKKYRSGPKITLTDRVKAVLIKIWFAGMTCYFFYWGLGPYVAAELDKIVILGIALGLITELLTNNLFRFMARKKGGNDRWILFTARAWYTFPLNILYGLLLVFCVVNTYGAVNGVLHALGGEEAVLGVGPILFGVFTAGWDLVFLAVKRVLRSVVEDAKRAAR